MRTAYTVSVDARDGVTTGISAADRAHTIRLLADPATEPASSPGPATCSRCGREGGVLVRPGHTEAAVDLARLAGLTPAGAIAELVNDDGTMMRAPELRAFADEHGLAMISIADLIAYRRRARAHVERVAETRLPTEHGEFTAVGYRGTLDGAEHVALVARRHQRREPVLVRVHSECLTGDVFGSLRCDCGPQLDAALRADRRRGPRRRRLPARPRGPRHRPAAKLQAYAAPGRRPRHRRRQPRARPAGRRPRLRRRRRRSCATSASLDAAAHQQPRQGRRPRGLRPRGRERVPLPIAAATPHNLRYLRTKRDRMGHDLPCAERRADPRSASRVSGARAPAESPAGRRRRPAGRASSRLAGTTEVMDGLLAGAQRALADARVERRRPSCACRAPSSCRSWPARWPRRLRRASSRSASSSAAAPRTSTTSARRATDGLTRVALDTGVPVGFGVLTCDDEAQALDRAGPAGLQRGQGPRGGDGRRSPPRCALALPGRPVPLCRVKTFDDLFAELTEKAADPTGRARAPSPRSTPACTPSARRSSRRPPRCGWPPSTRARSAPPRRSASCSTTCRC